MPAELHQLPPSKSDEELTKSDGTLAKTSADYSREYRQRQREQAALDARLARHKAVVEQYEQDLGGRDALSASDKATIHCVATLTVQMQDIEHRFNAGDASADDLSLYNRLAGNMRRLLSTLPKRKHAGPRPPTIEEIEAEYAAADNNND